MSLIRPQNYLKNSNGINLYWSQLIRTVDEFDQLMDLQKREIASCIKDYYQKRNDLVKQFSSFKDSLKFQGEIHKKQLYFVQMNEFNTFFKGYHQNIIDIIEKIILQPEIIAALISSFQDFKKIKFDDFFQNIVFNIFPCYLPQSKNQSNLIRYMHAILQYWPYNIQLTRPVQYTLIDQAITGFMKTPTIVCYVQKIVSTFLQDASNYHMSKFAFDKEGVQNEMKAKKQVNATFSLYNQPKPLSFKDKIKNFFKKDEQQLMASQISISNEESFLSVQSVKSQQDSSTVNDIMKKRQFGFFELIKKTVENILSQQVPMLLCRMMALFDAKIQKLLGGKKQSRLKHYCYFFMTNLILSQLHNKFTSKHVVQIVSHQQSIMTHADLQNISQIIKIMNSLFQGISPQSQKYNQPAALTGYHEKIQIFYKNIIQRGNMQFENEQQLLKKLLSHYQKSLVLSINDLQIIITLLQNLPSSQNLIPQLSSMLQFLKIKDQGSLFDINNKKKNIKFKNVSYSPEQIYLFYDCRSPSIKEVIDYYLTIDQPITDIPLIKEILIKQSNLQLQQALEIDQYFKLMQNFQMKEIKGYLLKLASTFKQLKVKDGVKLQNKFEESFRSTLGRSIKRKQWLLYYRSQFSQRLGKQNALMQYFTGQLNSAQFYERMASSFIDNVQIKIFINIENNIFKVHKTAQDLKKMQISTLIVAKNHSSKDSNSSNQNYILRNSFKQFQSVKDLLRCIARNEITKAALLKGRLADEFNATFQEICQIIISKLSQFIAQKKIMQVLCEQKLTSIIIGKIQDYIYSKFKAQFKFVDNDKQLKLSATKINKKMFWDNDIAEFGLDQQFLVIEGKQKFQNITNQNSVSLKMKHFGELFKIIFTILGFTMAKNKISAQVVNPLVQYIILQCTDLSHHESLYSLQSLKWRQSPEDSYHLTLYQSSLTYIRQLMPKDYPLK